MDKENVKISIRLSTEQVNYLKQKAGTISTYIRTLIEKDMLKNDVQYIDDDFLQCIRK